jgi:hypothetical protein
MTAASPAMTVLVATSGHGHTLRRTLRHLRAQTIADRLELVLIGPTEGAFDDLAPDETAGFARCVRLDFGPFDEVERAYVPGIRGASAPIVALLENHVFPDPAWAASILRAFDGPWSAVGSVIVNANRDTATSWVEHLMSYGRHDETVAGGEVARIPRANSVFRRDVLLAFGDRLSDTLARDGGMLDSLRRDGHRFLREEAARMEHLNLSRPSSMLRLRFHSGRASADTRARAAGWSRARRIGYALASPAFPVLRLRAMWPILRSHAARAEMPRIAPLLALVLVLDAFSQAVGFALGAGRSAVQAGIYDLDREPHLNAADRARFMA